MDAAAPRLLDIETRRHIRLVRHRGRSRRATRYRCQQRAIAHGNVDVAIAGHSIKNHGEDQIPDGGGRHNAVGGNVDNDATWKQTDDRTIAWGRGAPRRLREGGGSGRHEATIRVHPIVHRLQCHAEKEIQLGRRRHVGKVGNTNPHRPHEGLR